MCVAASGIERLPISAYGYHARIIKQAVVLQAAERYMYMCGYKAADCCRCRVVYTRLISRDTKVDGKFALDILAQVCWLMVRCVSDELI